MMAWSRGLRGLRGGIAPLSRVCSLRLREYATESVLQSPAAAQIIVAPAGVSPTDPLYFAGVVEATRQFHTIHGHFVVPVGFGVPKQKSIGPDGDEERDLTASLWPAELGGFPLGYRLKALLTNPSHRIAQTKIINELRGIGLPVDGDWREFLWKNMTLKGLQVYKELHSDLLVPRNFRVPFGDAKWPRSIWGFRLGLRVMNMRQQRYDITPSEAVDLNAMGFVWDVYDHVWRTQLLPALVAFKSVYGHCNVEQAFTVPPHAPWPPATWNLALGNAVNRMRSSDGKNAKQVQRDHEILDEIGFAWDAMDDKWDRIVLPAFETYARLYGKGKRPPFGFAVPAEAPWPEATWSLVLGNYIQSIRTGSYQQQVLRDALRLQDIGWLEYLTSRWESTIEDTAATATPARNTTA